MASEIHFQLDIDFPAYSAKNLERFEQVYDDICRDFQ